MTAVASSLLYHPTISHYLRYISTVLGRDKLLRLIQYLSRFYAWYLYRTNNVASSIVPYTTIKAQFGLTRKILRVGKNVEHFKAAAIAHDSKGLDALVKWCSVGRQLGYAGYLTADMVTLRDALGWKMGRDKTRRWQEMAWRFWAVGLAFSVVSGSYNLWGLRRQEGRVDKREGEGVVALKRIERERAQINMQLLSDLCDLTIPLSGLGLANLEDGVVGLAGSVSSVIGIYAQWKKTV